MKVSKNNSRFSPVEILIFLIIILVIGSATYYLLHKKQNTISTNSSTHAYNSAQFSVNGNKLLNSKGQPYIPLGVTVFGISRVGWQNNIAGDIDQINTSASFWHANIVRIQVAPYYLDSNAQGYLTAVEKEVNSAEKVGLNVIISAQYENTKAFEPTAAPVDSTSQFWKLLAPVFASDSRVWFDLFNEPTANRPYSVWKNGGTGSDGKSYVGMQTLVNSVRSVAPNNVIVAESISSDQHFTDIGNYLLDGSNIIYAVHPYLHSPTLQTLSWWQDNWRKSWGNFASQHPLLIGEWGEYEGPKWECQTNAPVIIPGFLAYISSLHLGLIGWALTPGDMIRGTSLTTPNAFDPGVAFDCKKSNTGPTSQGAGSDILKYFTNKGIYQ
jgi:hypothetical protein